MLEQKRRALLREAARLEEERDRARRVWEATARDAERWWHRAALLGGERPLELACALVEGEAQVSVARRSMLGVVRPESAEVTLPPPPPAPRATSALAYAVRAHRRAVEAAARVGALERAYAQTRAEVRATTRRLRAIERRWIPEHERALAALELALDEADREDAARVRWVLRLRR